MGMGGEMISRLNGAREKQDKEGGRVFFRPSGAGSFSPSDPQLTPWAVFFRRFAAGSTALPEATRRRSVPAIALFSLGAILLVLAGCSKDKAEEAAVAVKAAPVEETTIQRVVAADGVLFPLQQASLVPKISSPVKTFYVNKGSRVHRGQLLAVLENQDLAAAAEDNKGTFEQAEAAYTTGTASSVPEEMLKATSDAESAKQLYDAEQKLYDSRQELFKEGALPRKDLDQAAVSLAQARAQ
jgi:HlyD family secretion protein